MAHGRNGQQREEEGSALDRLPPQNLEAEQAGLGSVLINPDRLFELRKRTQPEYHYREAHRVIHEAILRVSERGEPIDPHVVTEELRVTGRLDAVGGAAYLWKLMDSVPTGANTGWYADTVREKAVLRSLIEVSCDIASAAYGPIENAEEKLATWEDRLSWLRHWRDVESQNTDRTFGEEIVELYSVIANREDAEIVKGISTGMACLDAKIGGWRKKKIYVIAGRSSMGKTGFVLSSLRHSAPKASTLFFSLDMPKEEQNFRLLSMITDIPIQRLESAVMSEREGDALNRAVLETYDWKLKIDDTNPLSVGEMMSRARRHRQKHGLDLLVVDYLQLVKHGYPDQQNIGIKAVMSGFRQMVKEFDCPLIALSQVNRAVEKTGDKR
jgi:replicative DNA helicase